MVVSNECIPSNSVLCGSGCVTACGELPVDVSVVTDSGKTCYYEAQFLKMSQNNRNK